MMAPKGAGNKRAGDAVEEAGDKKRARIDGSTTGTLTPAQRAEAKEKLDAKIAEFKTKMKKLGDDKPNLELLKQHFTPAEMSALWMRLKKERQGANFSVQEAWDTICSMKVGSREHKNATMIDFLMLPRQQWHTSMLKTAEIIRKTEKSHNAGGGEDKRRVGDAARSR